MRVWARQGFSTSTGYFGIPGRIGGMVHAVRDGRPLCGRRDPRAVYLWCAWGWVFSYLECRRCIGLAQRRRAADAA